MSGAPEPSTEPATPRHEADGLFENGEYEAAEALFLKLADLPDERSWATFQLGRIGRRQGRTDDALKWFDAALGAGSPVAWARYERADVLFETGDERGAVEDLVAFALDPPDGFSRGHRPLLFKAAEIAFSRGNTMQAGCLFGLLVERFEDDAHARLRQADILLMDENPHAALEMIEPIAGDPRRSGWVDLVRARALMELGRNEEAAAVLIGAVQDEGTRSHVAHLLVRVLDTIRRTGGTAPSGAIESLSSEQRDELELRDALRTSEVGRIALILGRTDPAPPLRLAMVAEALEWRMSTGDHAGLDAIAAILPASVGSDPRILSTRLCAAIARKRWAEAEAMVALAGPALGSSQSHDLRLRVLEFFCFTMKLDQADAHLAAYHDMLALDAARPVIASLHAARKRWQQVIALAGDSVAARRSIDHPTFLEALGRATRRTDRYGEVLGLLAAAIADTGSERIREFADRLAAEFSLLEATRPDDTGPQATPRNDGLRERFPLIASTLALQIRALQRAPLTPSPRSVLLCSDSNYLLGTAVAAFSLLRNNPGLRAGLGFTVVCASESLALAGSVFAAIGQVFGVAIDVRPETSIMSAPAALQTGWGLFTPGHSLSAAAYWRIYAARCLLAEGRQGRLLYVDSDTMVGPNLEDLIDRDLNGEPVAARPELAIPEIMHAAVGLGIEPEHYFNSGVLLFDLDCRDLPALLDAALDISINRQEILTFVDQCALNLAFKSRTCFLDQRFNDFVRQRSALNHTGEAMVVTHYLDRPKPWDPMYRGSNAQPWLREWEILSRFLSFDDRRTLIASALRW